MLNSAWPIYFHKAPEVGLPSTEPVPEAVYLLIDDELVMFMKWSAWDLRIQPRIKHLARRSRDRPFNLDLKGPCARVHHFFFSSFFLSLKYCSNWSRRSFQNRSYSCSHPATSWSGSPRNEM